MVNEKLRKAIANYYMGYEEDEQPLLFTNQAYDNSIIGFTDDGRAIYDYQKMVEELMQDDNCSMEDAMEWINYNTIRSIPYAGEHAPIIVDISIEELLEGYGE